mmetsp:Transcript_23769/g.52792  ORF Transcript_23769/g.52792 Transcript_23769/m.52792 type:complete len:159 (-) Transcript_23769:2082-2558(-)
MSFLVRVHRADVHIHNQENKGLHWEPLESAEGWVGLRGVCEVASFTVAPNGGGGEDGDGGSESKGNTEDTEGAGSKGSSSNLVGLDTLVAPLDPSLHSIVRTAVGTVGAGVGAVGAGIGVRLPLGRPTSFSSLQALHIQSIIALLRQEQGGVGVVGRS